MGIFDNIFGASEKSMTPAQEEKAAQDKAIEQFPTYEHKGGDIIEKKPPVISKEEKEN